MRQVLRSVGVLVACAALLATAPARADDPFSGFFSDGWTVTIGGEARSMPSYVGSDRNVLLPIPVIDIRRAGTPRRFSSERDGASIGILEADRFRAGVVGKLVLPRYERDDGDLRGLGNVGWTVEPGLFVEFWPVQWLRTRLEVRQGIGGHTGQLADLTADFVVPVNPQVTVSGGPRLTYATSAALSPYFSVNATQSAASGLPVYDARGGLRSYGVGGMARYEISQQWATHFYMTYERLAGDVANSPLVRLRGSADQVTAGLGVTYSFDIGKPAKR